MNLFLLIGCIILGALYMIQQTQSKKLKNENEELEKTLADIKAQPRIPDMGNVTPQQAFPEHAMDRLTGLPNYDVFYTQLNQVLYQAKRYDTSFALMTLDINKFGKVNELGQDIGDLLLTQLAERFKLSIRQVDALTRLEGNHFLFLLPQLVKPEVAAYVAQRIQDSIIQPFMIEHHCIFVTASIGIAIYPDDAATIDDLLIKSNKALQLAKERGQNTYQFYGQEIHKRGERMVILAALVRDETLFDHLIIQYQPQVMISAGTVEGVHAGFSLQHTALGNITQQELMKAGESSGKDAEVSLWLLKKALQQTTQWKNDGIKVDRLAVTISFKLIENITFIESMAQLLQEYNSVKVVFEITDEAINPDRELLKVSLQAISRLQIGLAVGIQALGNFALQNIHNLPINYLMVNDGIINNAVNHAKNEEVLHAMIKLAQESGIEVIAADISNEKQKVMLADMGCQVMQGRLFEHHLVKKVIAV